MLTTMMGGGRRSKCQRPRMHVHHPGGNRTGEGVVGNALAEGPRPGGTADADQRGEHECAAEIQHCDRGSRRTALSTRAMRPANRWL